VKFCATIGILLFGSIGFSATVSECESHRNHGREAQAKTCYTALIASTDPATRAEGYWGVYDHMAANEQFKQAHSRNPKNAQLKTRWGMLYLDHDQPGDAADLFEEALEVTPNYAPALLGIAYVGADRFDRKAIEYAEKALKADPKLVAAQELIARLALEDSNPKKAGEEADKALQMSPEALDAMTIKAAIEYLDDRDGGPWIAKIKAINPVYGKAHGLIGHLYVINRRYTEGLKEFEKALELSPQLFAVRAELGVNQMRLGMEDEARKNLEMAFNNGYKGNTTVNSLRLMDSYKRYNTYKSSQTIIRLQKKEADLLLPYMQTELERAITVFQKKYKFNLTAPVQLELFPDHEDFAVRTMGMPGLGALGVTFGYSVAMDSPSARKPGSFHWASTLWHELSHVFTLTATHHKIPRWFTEGLAVHEETAIHKDWGDRLDPEAIKAIKEKKLLPIAELDRGFIRPSYPTQVVVSYFQAGKICDYIEEKWGFDKLLAMIKSFDSRTPTSEVVKQQLAMEPAEFDKQFLAWLDTKVGSQVKNFDEWRKQMKTLSENAGRKQWDYVIAEGGKVRDLYPDYVEVGSAYELLADAYQAKNDNKSAIEQLQKYSDQGGRNPATLKKLGDLQTAAGMKPAAAKTLHRINYIYPQDEELHLKLGNLYLDLGDKSGAIREFEALVASKPLDQAGSRYLLARAYQGANRLDDAKDQVVQALEAAPGFRPAQKLLLELNRTK
jgi:tetratricopeptide (TPR) repeat protein